MSKINVLSYEIANLIAAGEVVERPSSVLKELIENSIDSGATSIVCEIKRGGVALIRVSDNGCGIDKEDLPVALKRHATSKIREKTDLDSIMTLGFRGEALAAISSVSSMTIISKTKDSESATMLTAEAGNVVDISEVGAADGTTVVVENLFYNVPARRKFLKKDSTEAMNVAALVEKVALSRPDISIQLLIDGNEKFKTPGNSNVLDAIRAIYGRDFSSKLINCDGTTDGIRVHGFIGRSDNVRKNRNMQNFFINGRYVKSMTVMAALEKAYTSYIAPEAFPSCVLYIEMNPGAVDVNVHPAKLEIKFSDERIIFEAVYYTVKTAIESFEYRPELTLGAKKSEYKANGAFIPIGEDAAGKQISIEKKDFSAWGGSYSNGSDYKENRSAITANISKETAERASFNNKSFSDYDKPYTMASPTVRFLMPEGEKLTPKESIDLLNTYKKASFNEESVEVVKEETKSNNETQLIDYKIIGEAFDCYIFVESDGEILIIDKHAAHERIIFEDLKKSRETNGSIASQSLILPITVLLSSDELSCASDFKDEFEAIGFEFNINENACDILSIPEAITASDAEALFVKMVGELLLGIGNPSITESIRKERALYQIACKAAIKGGRMYDKSITSWLVSRVFALPDITVCPHGRPIAFKLTKSELDKKFERLK